MNAGKYTLAVAAVLALLGGSTAAGPLVTHAPPTEQANLAEVPEGPYRFDSSPGIEDAVQEAIHIWEQGSGVSIHDPNSTRPASVESTDFAPTWTHDNRSFTGLAKAVRNSLNGYILDCQVTVNGTLEGEALVLVLVHEIGHCLGLEHADSGIMSGGYVEGQYPSVQEFRAVHCALTTPLDCGATYGPTE